MSFVLPSLILAVAGGAVALLVNDARASLKELARDASALSKLIATVQQELKDHKEAERVD